MSHKLWVVALSVIVATSPSAAATAEPPAARSAPAGSPDARYCLRVEAVTGSLIETVNCWTRTEWADQGVDVDEEWAKEGVAVIGPRYTSLK